MKIKDRCGKLGNEAGISLKTKNLPANSGNVVENKGSYLLLGRKRWALGVGRERARTSAELGGTCT
jgi:hypothetical protein